MTTATERIPILVTKADKAKFARKAKAFGLSISEFARTAMDSFDPTDDDELEALSGMIAQIRRGTAEADKALGDALSYCASSQARLKKLEAWLREQGYVQ
jgi:hypothetical protein